MRCYWTMRYCWTMHCHTIYCWTLRYFWTMRCHTIYCSHGCQVHDWMSCWVEEGRATCVLPLVRPGV